MTAIFAGVVLALTYALGWWRGYVSYKESPDQLRQRRADADAAAVAALKRAVKAEAELERLRADTGRGPRSSPGGPLP